MIIDVCLFNNENELFSVRYHALKDIVDQFIVVEFSQTFSGLKKEQNFNISSNEDIDASKIVYRFLNSPEPINGAQSGTLARTDANKIYDWKHNKRKPKDLEEGVRREIAQRDKIYDILKHYAVETDIILVSDVDEIPNPDAIRRYIQSGSYRTHYLEMDWRLFYSNLTCNEPWYGTYITTLKDIERYSLDVLRIGATKFPFDSKFIIEDAGIHMSYLGGRKKIQDKLRDLPFQGMRAEITKSLINKLPIIIDIMLYFHFDILLQNRRFDLLELDQQRPYYISSLFYQKYAK